MRVAEWLAYRNPLAVVESLTARASARQLRLFACAVCRDFWPCIEDERSRQAVAVAERFADGLASRRDLASCRAALPALERNRHRAAIARTVSEPAAFRWAFGWDLAKYTVRAQAADAARMAALAYVAVQNGNLTDPAVQGRSAAPWLHDLFGQLVFPTASLDRAWLTPTVVQIADAIYADRAFDRLPVLADALEDAGCTSQEMLEHGRSGDEHARGCWLVDLVLAHLREVGRSSPVSVH